MLNFFNLKKAYGLIPGIFKGKLNFFILSNFIISTLELLSLGLIYSIINLLVNKNSKIKFLNYELQDDNIIIFTLVLISLFILKNLILVFLYNWQYSYAAKVQRYLSCSLLKKYILVKYQEFIKQNSTIYMRNVDTETTRFNSYLSSALSLFTESVILSFVLIYLLYINFVSTLVILIVFFIIFIIFYILTKKKFKAWGEKRLFLSGQLIKGLIETFQNIKEIKIFNKESLFYERFKDIQKQTQNLSIKSNFIRILPRPLLEIIAIIAIGLFLIYVSSNNLEFVDFIPLLTIYLVSFVRILPSVNKILHNYQSIALNNPSILVLDEEVNVKHVSDLETQKTVYANKIEIKEMSFKYPDNKSIFEKFNFTFEKNKIYGVFGKNGSGKTTLINLILNLLKPISGEINYYLDNEKVLGKKIKFGYVPQNIVMIDSSIKSNIALEYDEKNIDKNKLKKCLNSSNLFKFISEFKDKEDTIVGENGAKLSGGQKQRIGIARSLFFNNNILILDEPSSALDKSNEKQFLDNLKELKREKIIIIISHNYDLKDYCDQIIQL